MCCRLGRRDHAAEAVAVGLERPALLGRQRVCLRLVVDGSDRLRRIGEGRVGRVDLDLRQERGEPLVLRQLVAQLLLEHVADHPLRLGVQDVERIGLDLLVGRSLERQQPDLRSVAVRDHELVLERDRRQRLAGDARVRALVLGGQGLPALEQRVAAERDDDAHGSGPQRGDHDGLDRVQAVLRLVPHDRRRRLEHLLGDLERIETVVLEDLLADRRCRGCGTRAGNA